MERCHGVNLLQCPGSFLKSFLLAVSTWTGVHHHWEHLMLYYLTWFIYDERVDKISTLKPPNEIFMLKKEEQQQGVAMNIYLKTLFLTDSHFKPICHLWLSYFLLVKPVSSCKFTKNQQFVRRNNMYLWTNHFQRIFCVNTSIMQKFWITLLSADDINSS